MTRYEMLGAALLLLQAAWPSRQTFAQFPTSRMEFLSQIPLASMGGGFGSGIWGWTDPQTGREYALFGRTNGTAFIDVTEPTQPNYLGNLPTHTSSSTWREIKVYQNYAYVVSDNNSAHGIQIFDLTTLRGVSAPQTFTETAHFAGVGDVHNIAINEESGFAYAVDTNSTNRVIDLSNPTQPVNVSVLPTAHDVQVVNYHGPDADYAGREILVASTGANDRIRIQDVTDKQNVITISEGFYPNPRYTHQGWFTDDQRFFFMNDELDSRWTHRFDLSDLDHPQYLGSIAPLQNSTDHNLYVKGKYLYAANYQTGLHVFEVNGTTGDLSHEAWIDTYPAGNAIGFNGAWSVYPFFDSGTLVVSDMTNGLVVARLDLFPGDFNHDGLLNCLDIDSLTSVIATGSNITEFDLTGDGHVTIADRDAWLAEAGAENLPSQRPYRLGDATLNGIVDGSDFSIWNANKFSNIAAWCSGDFTADGVVDGSDFGLWNTNKFTSLGTGVPEPQATFMLVTALFLARWWTVTEDAACLPAR